MYNLKGTTIKYYEFYTVDNENKIKFFNEYKGYFEELKEQIDCFKFYYKNPENWGYYPENIENEEFFNKVEPIINYENEELTDNILNLLLKLKVNDYLKLDSDLYIKCTGSCFKYDEENLYDYLYSNYISDLWELEDLIKGKILCTQTLSEFKDFVDRDWSGEKLEEIIYSAEIKPLEKLLKHDYMQDYILEVADLFKNSKDNLFKRVGEHILNYNFKSAWNLLCSHKNFVYGYI